MISEEAQLNLNLQNLNKNQNKSKKKQKSIEKMMFYIKYYKIKLIIIISFLKKAKNMMLMSSLNKSKMIQKLDLVKNKLI